MGVNLKELFTRKEIALEDLSGRKIAIDAFNTIYQFLTTIRTRDGKLLTDSRGHVTSHLIGLLTRTSHMFEVGISPVYVFDGEPPKLKEAESLRRHEAKEEARQFFKKAEAAGDIEAMRKYASRSAFLTDEMIADSKKLLALLGVPVVQAPSEGEAQCSFIAKQGDAWAVGSQDYDSLLYGTPRLLQNLSIAGRRKKAGTLSYTAVSPQLIELEPNLKKLGINQEQLIALAMLIGTDYNPGGIKGIGPKNALKLLQKHGKNYEALFKEVEWEKHGTTPWQQVLDLFKKMPVTKKYDLKQRPPNKEEIISFLSGERDFNTERVVAAVEKVLKSLKERSQKGLGEF